MKILSERSNGVLVARVSGRRLAADTAGEFKIHMAEVLKESGASSILLDLSAVQFIDSTGVGSIVSVLKTLSSGTTLSLAGLSGAVQQLFTLTRMDKVFPIYPSVEAALANIARPSKSMSA